MYHLHTEQTHLGLCRTIWTSLVSVDSQPRKSMKRYPAELSSVKALNLDSLSATSFYNLACFCFACSIKTAEVKDVASCLLKSCMKPS